MKTIMGNNEARIKECENKLRGTAAWRIFVFLSIIVIFCWLIIASFCHAQTTDPFDSGGFHATLEDDFNITIRDDPVWDQLDSGEVVICSRNGNCMVLNDLLKRCLEFVDDLDTRPQYGIKYIIDEPEPTPYESLMDSYQAEINRTKRNMEKLTRERQLRRDLERALRYLEEK